MKKKKCPLCDLAEKENAEKVFYEDDEIIIVRTKDLKGHKERIMVVSKGHVRNISFELFEHAMMKLIEIGKKAFSYYPKFVVMEGTFQRLKKHWHIVASDLDPNTEDYYQILHTDWIDAISTENKK